MITWHKWPRQLREAGLSLIGAGMVAYFAYHTVQGDQGLLALAQLRKAVALAEAEREAVRGERLALEHRTEGLIGPTIDGDLLDEQVRIQLGYGRDDEVFWLRRSQ